MSLYFTLLYFTLLYSNVYSNLGFPILMIEKVPSLIDAITLQFPPVGDVLSP